MAIKSFDEWWADNQGVGDPNGAYAEYTAANGGGTGGASGIAPAPLTLGMKPGGYQRPAGIPEYGGYQAPDYAATTPNNTHWLNTMNAFAPTARNDMSRLLGPGATGYTGGTQSTAPRQLTPGQLDAFGKVQESAYAKRATMPTTGLLAMPTQKPLTPMTGSTDPFSSAVNSAYTQQGGQTSGLLGSNTQQAPSQYPFQGQAPGYMDAFYNTSGSAYNTQQNTQQNTYQSPSNNWSNGTVGIDPATGALTFLGNP